MSDCCATDGLMRLEVALSRLINDTNPVSGTETVALESSLGRVLAEQIISPINVPAHDNSAMDGYALAVKDLQSGDTLPLAGQSLAGHPYSGEIPAGQCIRIMTGASIPPGADVVIMQEQAEATEQGIRFLQKPVKSGNNIRKAGEDIPAGAQVFTPGRRIRPQDIGLLASLGIAQVKVYRKVRVAVFSTGDELKLPGEPLGPGDIYDSNRFVIKAMLKKLAVDIIDLGKIPDDKAALREAFLRADREADAVISSGGVSVGDADYTKDILDELGETGFWKLAIKPGKPFAFGQLPNSVFFGLPGNPVSATVTFQQLAAPTLRHMMNQQPEQKIELTLTTETQLRKRPGRRDFQRGRLVYHESGELQVLSTGHQGSGVLSTMSGSDCYIVLAEEDGDKQAGERVKVQLFDELLQ
ncbi:molybdopterin molybdotransferase MoeA [Endozoicomonas sp. SCSIO W0465]|uniref:molybdopterin molybdotransferase MoeA n=1 Tax=Endozoicomonas sp. SCSIO W0465 TaxID=2918516 RepID=UPI0020750FFF|nr:molybdopterin molybdotransferase MoeA [Endozoicomonas sp. SCSIO W0465]USE37896.1 molybdopterin molybdotransferase MoeA [Endozoicomonas sp. SCSIO W0465]